MRPHVPVFLKRATNESSRILRVPKKRQVSAAERSLRDAELIRLYRKGRSPIALAYLFNMSTQNVFRLLKVNGVEVKKHVRNRVQRRSVVRPAPTVPQCACKVGFLNNLCPWFSGAEYINQ